MAARTLQVGVAVLSLCVRSALAEVRRVIRASLCNRAKESLLVDVMNQTDLDQLSDKTSVIVQSIPARPFAV